MSLCPSELGLKFADPWYIVPTYILLTTTSSSIYTDVHMYIIVYSIYYIVLLSII